jgi:pentatricopeptide repeat protein
MFPSKSSTSLIAAVLMLQAVISKLLQAIVPVPTVSSMSALVKIPSRRMSIMTRNGVVPNEAQQLLLVQRQIKGCGSHVINGLTILRHITHEDHPIMAATTGTSTTATNTTLNLPSPQPPQPPPLPSPQPPPHPPTPQPQRTLQINDDTNSHSYEPLYLEALALIGRAKRSSNPNTYHNIDTTRIPYLVADHWDANIVGTLSTMKSTLHPIQQIAMQLYHECPTDACRARTIAICNTAYTTINSTTSAVATANDITATIADAITSTKPETVGTTVSIAIQLLHHGLQPPSIQSYHATLAACDYSQAIHIVQVEMSQQNNNHRSFATTLTYNIVLTALYRAKQGVRAYQLLQQMMESHPTSTLLTNDAQHTLNHHDDMHSNDRVLLPPPDLNSFQITIKALIATATTINTNTMETLSMDDRTSQYIDTAYTLCNVMLDYGFEVRTATIELLISAYSRLGDWSKVQWITAVHLQYQQHVQLQHPNTQSQSFRFPNVPPPNDEPVVQPTSTITNKTLNNNTIANQHESYFSSTIRSQWERGGLKKDQQEKYWKIGTYVNHGTTTSSTDDRFVLAIQPHRNPGKNGIQLVMYHRTSDGHSTTTPPTKVGYLLMINQPMENNNLNHNSSSDTNTTTQMLGSSSLLGVYLDPQYRQLGLSKLLIAIWLQLCHQARALPRTGVMNKPLLVLVLQHTFSFVPEITTTGGNNGVNVEVSVVPDQLRVETNPITTATSQIGIYSSNVKSLQGIFSMRDLRREKIQLLRDPCTPQRGRVCRIGASFVLPQNLSTNPPFVAMIQEQIRGKALTGQLRYNTNEICWKQVFFGCT